MSAWGKVLAPITVPTGGWDWGWGDESTADNKVTIPAGTYSTILSLATALEAQMDEVATSTVTVSSVGRVTIAALTMTAANWASCSDDLLTALGYAESETVSGDSVTASASHLYGWYPGTISHGITRGEGLASDTAWRVVDETARVKAGSGQMRAIAPSRRSYERTLRFAAIRRAEYEHRTRGVALLEEWGATREMRWYPDRDVGTVDTPGTQADPATTRTDASGYYWLVTLAGDPSVEWSSQYPDLCSVTITFNGEPA